eukprot:g4080.t1
MRRTTGRKRVYGSLAYVAQNPHIFNMTVRDNIIYFLPFDEEKFRAVVNACALQVDFDLFPAGEDTEVGERGLNLSGGQKARIALARALYADADVILLDDPLAAVDQGVAETLFHNSDIDIMDVTLPDNAELCMTLLLQSYASIVVIVILLPAFGIFAIPIIAAYLYLTRLFRRVVRQMKRFDNRSRSPIFSHLSSMSQGLSTIVAFGMGPAYMRRNRFLVDENQRANFAFWMCNRWIGVRLDVLTTCVCVLVSLVAVMFRETISASTAGLCIVYSLQMGGVLQFSTRLITQTEAMLTSVERLTDFANTIPIESGLTASSSSDHENPKTIPGKWPQKGAVQFRDVQVRYRPGLPLVLRGMTFDIPAGCKVGVCGRTGSGKSTLILALFRLLEVEAGKILLDGIDVSKVPLQRLRSCLSCIPQEPVLFAGTIRSNLDPFLEYNDDAIWEALERVSLKAFVQSLDGKLSFPVTVGGENLSAGERQLFCIARALLRRAKVIVMDEATAACDGETDRLAQNDRRQ